MCMLIFLTVSVFIRAPFTSSNLNTLVIYQQHGAFALTRAFAVASRLKLSHLLNKMIQIG